MNLAMRTHLKMDAAPGAAGTPPATPPAGTPPATPPAADWTTGMNELHKGVVTAKGWNDINAVMDSYTGLEKLMGAPKDKLLRIPDDFGDEKAMGEVYDRFGRPKEAKEYGFKAADEKMDKWARETFHKLGLSANQGKALMESYDALAKAENEAADGTFKAQNEQKINALKTEWSNAYEQNVNTAKAAAAQFGITAENLTKIESVMGFAETMKLMHSIGSKIGEAPFLNGGGTPPANFVLTPAQATAKIAELSKDKVFFEKLMKNDVQAKNEWEKYNKMAAGNYQA